MGDIQYPRGHQPGTKVPSGGSSCYNCKWVRPDGESPTGTSCANKYYQEWAGTNHVPEAAEEYCSDWWEPQEEAPEGSDDGDEGAPKTVAEAFARHLATSAKNKNRRVL